MINLNVMARQLKNIAPHGGQLINRIASDAQKEVF
jgi:sulfate adenylyltransferase